jgi:hypothetical protein
MCTGAGVTYARGARASIVAPRVIMKDAKVTRILVFVGVRRLVLVIGLAFCIAPAASALADTTIGQTGGGTACHPFNGAVAGDADYVVPSRGRITSFSFQSASANAGNQIDFLVLRPGGGSNYTVVGKTGVKTLQGTGLETFFPRHEIAAHGGDILGFWVITPPNVGFPNCIHIVPGHGGIHATANQTADPNVGDTLKFPLSTQSDDLNESAKLVMRKHHRRHHHRHCHPRKHDDEK